MREGPRDTAAAAGSHWVPDPRKKETIMSLQLKEKNTVVTNSNAIKEGITAFNQGDLEGAIAPYAADAEVVDPTGTYKGKPQILRSIQSWHTAFPDAKGEVTNQIGHEDQVLTEVTFRGTHSGPLAGPAGTLPATGKKTEMRVAYVDQFRDGKVWRERAYFDLAGLMQQLGLAKNGS
jgi:steroid delta-isomerase-like uncharacterized protein